MQALNSASKKNKILLIVIVLLLIIIGIGILLYLNQDDGVSKTAVIQTDTKEELNDPSSGNLRIKICPVVTVKDDTMQNLNFANYNQDRLLECKIKCGGKYVYDSGYLPQSKILVGDFVDTSGLSKGENEALAEIYSYSLDKKPIGQTNVELTLNVQ
jgi:hypothetical protein